MSGIYIPEALRRGGTCFFDFANKMIEIYGR